MRTERPAAFIHDLQALFESGVIGQRTDCELLRRICDRHDEPAEPAFAALVERHGPMVLRVCRSILRNEHDAQDAFQATFLVLVRRAGSVRNRESIGSWLYGVALRVASCARSSSANRRLHERRAAERTPSQYEDDGCGREVAAIVHEELGRLPERYRAVVVLCYLEGLTCGAAAQQLGLPVGTVKSRLSRGRERLLRRLIHRGLGPDNASSPPQGMSAVLPAALGRDTLRAMLELVVRRSIDDLVSVNAQLYARAALRTMRLIRVTMISALVIGSLVVAAGASLTIPRQESARPATASKATAKKGPPGVPIEIRKNQEVLFLHVVDIHGQGAPNVEVKVQGRNTMPEARLFRTGQGGWLKVTVDDLFDKIEFEARPDAQTIGWANIRSGELTPTGRENDPVQMVLLPRNHRVEGSVVDVRGKPIGGVVVQVVQLDHDINRFASSYGLRSEDESLGQAITDEAGRYTLKLPHDTRAIFLAYHRRYVGPMMSSKAEDRTVKPVTLQDAGGIAGTVTDSTTKEPVAGAKVAAQVVEHGEQFVGGGWGEATSDARGHFVVGGLAPSVYNLLFSESPKGKMFVARAVVGVRVKAREDAQADLVLIMGRRLQGTAFDTVAKKPMAGVPIFAYNLSRPRSSAACQGTTTDNVGHFELFVPPGPVFVYIAQPGLIGSSHRQDLVVADDKDPAPIVLERRYAPEAGVKARPTRVDECAVLVRVSADDAGQQKDVRTLAGRIVDPAGLPIASVRVYYNSMKFVEAATDRLGMFRLKGLPQGEFRIGIDKGGYGHGWAKISPDAHEVDITLLRSAEPD